MKEYPYHQLKRILFALINTLVLMHVRISNTILEEFKDTSLVVLFDTLIEPHITMCILLPVYTVTLPNNIISVTTQSL